MVGLDQGGLSLHVETLGQPFSPNFFSMHVSGLAYLRADDNASISVIAEEDDDYALDGESFFSVARIETA